MADFRAYIMDHDGHVKLRVDLPGCANETDATQRAKRMIDRHDIELWDGAKFIERFRRQQDAEQLFCAASDAATAPDAGLQGVQQA
jgi:hypothetical protein